MNIQVYPLGAGQEVGRSCILVSFNSEKYVLLDCGVHMGIKDKRKYPNFDLLLKTFNKKDINDLLDAVLITHFHLDHCAALPILTEEKGYNGPILASEPTKAIFQFMLIDYMNVSNDGIYQYSRQMIKSCSSKISTIDLESTKKLNGLKITAYYAGHVLGAVMFAIEYKGKKVVYTGDYNTSPDRHLSGCRIDKIEPDVLISESTYASVNRDWKKTREMQFMTQIKETLDNGGKVLIPVFALGRAQEFFVLIEDIWKKTGWNYPVYFSSGLSSKVHFFYQFYSKWMNININKQIQKSNNPFNLKKIQKFEKIYAKLDQPMLVLATPGMLHGGISMEIFKEWCHESKNRIIIPGYCIKGTLGNIVLSGAKQVKIDENIYKVNMKVSQMSFSAHADNKGIVNLVEHLQPKFLVFVHGEKSRMEKLQIFVQQKLKIKTYCPKNFQILNIILKKQSQDFFVQEDNSSWEIYTQSSQDSKSKQKNDNDQGFNLEEQQKIQREEYFYSQSQINDQYLKEKRMLIKKDGPIVKKIQEVHDDMYLVFQKQNKKQINQIIKQQMKKDQMDKNKSKISDFTQNQKKTQRINQDTKTTIMKQLQYYKDKQFGRFYRMPFKNMKVFLALGFFLSSISISRVTQLQKYNKQKEQNNLFIINNNSNCLQCINDLQLLRISQREQMIDKLTLPQKEYNEIYNNDKSNTNLRQKSFQFSRGYPRVFGDGTNAFSESF